MRKKILTIMTVVLLICSFSGLSSATHLVDHHQGDAIDFINGIFSSGGGSFSGSLSPSGSLDWFLFGANIGDVIRIETVSPISNFDTGLSLVVDLLDGLPQVGDILNQGVELTWLAEDDDGGAGLLSRIDFTILETNNYAIAIGGFGGSTGDYTLELEGNTANFNSSVPEPSTMLLLGGGLLGLLAFRRKFKT